MVAAGILLIITPCGCTNSNVARPRPSFSQSAPPVTDDVTEPLRTLDQISVVKNTGLLPIACKSAFSVLAKQSEFEMAEPGERFQSGDVVTDHLPWRRLVFGGVSRDRCLIYYERGGRGLMYAVVVFDLSSDQKATFLYGMGIDKQPDLQRLRFEMLRPGKVLSHSQRGWQVMGEEPSQSQPAVQPSSWL
jgi:hypothetical protein